ncbi:hypothetical protein HI914_01696 [Erysiphe necator]|nr:hypothetical protein HI914_01696 [Erysiphe necator]
MASFSKKTKQTISLYGERFPSNEFGTHRWWKDDSGWAAITILMITSNIIPDEEDRLTLLVLAF